MSNLVFVALIAAAVPFTCGLWVNSLIALDFFLRRFDVQFWYMKVVMLLGVTAGSIAAAFGSELAITSPDHARTFAYGEMVWHQLYVDPTNHAFTARITLSNLPYVGSGDPRVDNRSIFVFLA